LNKRIQSGIEEVSEDATVEMLGKTTRVINIKVCGMEKPPLQLVITMVSAFYLLNSFYGENGTVFPKATNFESNKIKIF
jgi:hypothetical protein